LISDKARLIILFKEVILENLIYNIIHVLVENINILLLAAFLFLFIAVLIF